jgi:hypothetical protein
MERQRDRKTERGREGERERVRNESWGSPLGASSLRLSLSWSLCLSLSLSLCLTGCSRRNPAAEKQAAVDEFFVKARSCVPVSEPEDKLKLAIAQVTNQPDATRVRLVAYALDEAVDFYFPVYLMSAGRWLINEKGRAYLLNEQCREFKLKDRKSSFGGRKIPREGRIRLEPGQAFEVTLIFNRLPDQTRVGVLVYAGRVLPFTLHTEAQQAETK